MKAIFLIKGFRNVKDTIHFYKETLGEIVSNTILFPNIGFKSIYYDEINEKELHLPKIKIVPKRRLSSNALHHALSHRYSGRNFISALSKDELFLLLYYSVHSRIDTHRAFPSAGGRYSISLFINISDVVGIEPGLYYFDYFNEEISYFRCEIPNNRLREILLEQEFADKSSVTLFFIANTEIIFQKYGERGSRYIFLDAGHISQNFYLVATQMKIQTVSVGGFLDNEIVRELRLSDNEVPVYVQCFGK